MFPPLARVLSANPWLPRLFAWSAGIDREAAGRLIAGMGSKLDRRGLDLYARLLAKSGHCAGALQMMANWRLEPLLADLPRLAPRLLLIVGANDRAVSPADAPRLAARLARARASKRCRTSAISRTRKTRKPSRASSSPPQPSLDPHPCDAVGRTAFGRVAQ